MSSQSKKFKSLEDIPDLFDVDYENGNQTQPMITIEINPKPMGEGEDESSDDEEEPDYMILKVLLSDNFPDSPPLRARFIEAEVNDEDGEPTGKFSKIPFQANVNLQTGDFATDLLSKKGWGTCGSLVEFVVHVLKLLKSGKLEQPWDGTGHVPCGGGPITSDLYEKYIKYGDETYPKYREMFFDDPEAFWKMLKESKLWRAAKNPDMEAEEE